MLSSLAFPKERSSRDAKRGAPPGSLLYILCDSVQSRSMGNRQLASVTRALLQASLGKPQIRLPIAAAAFTRIVKVLHNNASLYGYLYYLLHALSYSWLRDELVLQVPALELLLQQAKADDALKNVVLAMVKPFSSHPSAIQLSLLRNLLHVVCCIDSVQSSELFHALSKLACSPNQQPSFLNAMLTGFRCVFQSVPDHRVKSAAIQTLASDELAKLIIAAGASSQSSRLYASCFEIVGINEIDSALPVTNEFTPVNLAGIFVRCELVRRGTLDISVLQSARTIVVGPLARQDTVGWLVPVLAQACAEAIAPPQRLSWLLNLFDLAAASPEPNMALHVIGEMVCAWGRPFLAGDLRQLATSLPTSIASWDDFSIDTVVRRLVRLVSPSADESRAKAPDPNVISSLVPSLVAVGQELPRCAPVIVHELFTII